MHATCLRSPLGSEMLSLFGAQCIAGVISTARGVHNPGRAGQMWLSCVPYTHAATCAHPSHYAQKVTNCYRKDKRAKLGIPQTKLCYFGYRNVLMRKEFL